MLSKGSPSPTALPDRFGLHTAYIPAGIHLLIMASLDDNSLVRKQRCHGTHATWSGFPGSNITGIVVADGFEIGLRYVKTTVAWARKLVDSVVS